MNTALVIFLCMLELFITRQALHTHTVIILPIDVFPLLAAQCIKCCQHFPNSKRWLHILPIVDCPLLAGQCCPLGVCKYIQRQSGTLLWYYSNA